ncbi:hypothetical protein B0T22DRAFT_439178 [Podospora appendiculata]|uniref:Uncharacterized protein n=1 Tax=Podospora appendiculata TaxID=314037 RepID=A0AAE0X7K7_9PEZI|nr:hypothetical protein B0T22DRAFT_439178 [Podospora appendiculata]
MHYHSLLTATAALIALAGALPLNINLGAYSPALVVGDGEISFKEGGEAVTKLVETLQGAAVSGATRVAAPAAPAAEGATRAQAAAVNAAAKPILNDQTARLPIPGVSNELDPREREGEQKRSELSAPGAAAVHKRQLEGFDRALKFAEAALTKGPKIQLGTGAEGSGVGIIVDNRPAGAAAAAAVARAGTGIVVE